MMKLIFLYGPPGVGKLTVAQELAKITGYTVFHNHLTADLVSSIFPMGTETYAELVGDIRLDVLESAAKYKVPGLIFTFVYGVETFGGRSDDVFIKKAIEMVNRFHGQVLFVKLTCQEVVLHRRLQTHSRKKFQKVRKVKTLKRIQKDFDLNATVPFGKSLIIDNTNRSPRQVALMIKRHYRLKSS